MRRIIGTPGNDILSPGYGLSLPVTIYGGDGSDTITGGNSDDFLFGEAGKDTISGGRGHDYIEGGADADMIDGGEHEDTASYESSDAGVRIDLMLGVGSGGHATGDVLRSIENLVGSGFADILSGDSVANILAGGAGNDRLYGRDGDDTLEGGLGRDYLDGGKDTDAVSYAGSASSVKVNLATGYAAGGDAEGDTLVSIESLIGSAHADILAGNSESNVLDGGAGDDLIFGGDGSNDSYIGGDGIDTLSFASSSHGVLASLLGGVALVDLDGDGSQMASEALTEPLHSATGFENLEGSALSDYLEGDAGDNTIVGGAGDDEIKGSWGNDELFGDAGSDRILGGVGNDHIYGGDGIDSLEGRSEDDWIEGGAGGDTLDGGSGIDTLSYASSNAAVSIDLQTGAATGGHADADIIFGFEDLVGSAHGDVLIGSSGSNADEGSSGDNRIEGGDGDDIIRGRGGIDQLWGGAGNDRFVLDASDASNLAPNIETIHDFTAGGDEDAIDLTNAGTGYASLDDVLDHSQSVTTDDGQAALQLDFGESGSVLLVGIEADQLTASDFIF